MGRVRYYAEDGEHYITLQVEDDGLYLLGSKVRIHAKRTKMPPKREKQGVAVETSTQTYARLTDPDILEKLLRVLDDFDETIRLDPESMVSLKPAFKASGCQLGVKYRNAWSNHPGKSCLETLMTYFEEITE